MRTYLRSPNCWRSSPSSSSSESKDRFLWKTIRSQERSITKVRFCVPVQGEWVRHQRVLLSMTTLPCSGIAPTGVAPSGQVSDVWLCPSAITDWPAQVNQILLPRNLKLEQTYNKDQKLQMQIHFQTAMPHPRETSGELKMFHILIKVVVTW